MRHFAVGPAVALVILRAPLPLHAQEPSDSAAIAAVVADYVRGWREADVPLLKEVFNARGQISWPGGAAGDSLRTMSFEELLKRRRPRPHFGQEWRIQSLNIVDGRAAAVVIWITDEPQGVVDLLTLYKMKGRWRVVAKAFVTQAGGS